MQVDQASLNESTHPPTWQRRKHIINPAFQWKYALTAGAVVFLAASVIGTTLYGVLHQQARLRAMNPDTYTAEVGTVILVFGLAFAALGGGAVTFWCMRITHRICGPLFVLDRYFTELAAGRFPQVRSLRQKDEFKDLHQSLQKAIDVLKEQKRIELAGLVEAARLAKGLASQVSGERQGDLARLLGHIEALRSSATQRLDQTPAEGERVALVAGSTAENEEPVDSDSFCRQPATGSGSQIRKESSTEEDSLSSRLSAGPTSPSGR